MEDPRDTRLLVPARRGRLLKFRKAGAERGSAEGNNSDGPGATAPSSADLFALVWHALADVLGTAAAATLLRRAAQRATLASPELSALEIARMNLEYVYRVPEAWTQPSAEPSQALCNLVRELWVLLAELTGSVVVARLSQVSQLRDCGLVPPRGQRP